MRVLVVDDDEEFRAAVAAALGPLAVVQTAATPVEAMWYLAHAPYEVLICDLRLATTTTGDDVLEVVREEWPRVVRILVTGFGANLHDVPHPAHAVLYKPLDLGALRDLLAWLPAVAASGEAVEPAP